MLYVAAALIRRGDRFLICRRPPEKSRGLLWEFVGGKLEPGETAQQAIIRECREELDITVRVTGEVGHVVYDYPDLTVDLTLLEVRITEGEPRLTEHVDMRWVTAEQAREYQLCPADRELLKLISRGALLE